MREKDLPIDLGKHVCYSKMAKKIMRAHLRSRYPKDEAEALWEKTQLRYAELLKDAPALGGKANAHNKPGGTYDCFAMMAWWDVQEEKPPLDELYDMNNEMLLPSFGLLGKIADVNRPWALKLMYRAFEAAAKRSAESVSRWPADYHMEFKADPERGRIEYRFTTCPIADFARRNGFTAIMPAFCNGDYPAMDLLHACLIRRNTCSNSDHCDYLIVPDRDPVCQEHPRYTDAAGYLRND